ncbi:uncharacterized protein LOC106880487 isoform X2 [Octopus bimaculoides]|uniref:uncharacterized protein LOC106880487 isoform X2 n=1 Tax=Octopus bimaculoides TaxID=37653 RepID=UPI0022E2BED6|nr:uncharacterized protein LOC106880487 isoform X2 [Octopus bimaculoides]
MIDEFKFLSQTLQVYFPENQDDHTNISATQTPCVDILDKIIKQHGKLCRLLKINNKASHVTVAITVLLFIITCCVLAHEISNGLINEKGYIIQLIFGMGIASACFLIISKGLQLNFNAHQLADHIYAMPLHDLSHEAIVKLSFFLHRLTSEQIGISIGGCFVINPASVLTLIGSIITYSIVAYQTRS